MKRYENISYDRKNFPEAVEIERMVNNCESADKHLKHLWEKFTESWINKFFKCCLLYWAEHTNYDERNKFAVLMSKKIREAFPKLANEKFDKDIEMNAFAFTSYAHRYLQNELFKCILKHLEHTEEDNYTGIWTWYSKNEFVIYMDTVMPYNEYKKLQL